MTLVHVCRPRGHYIGQVRKRGHQRWETVTGKRLSPERAMAAAVLRMSADHKRARVLFIDSGGWHEPHICMEASR